MNESPTAAPRIRVDERRAIGAAALGGVIAAASGAQPTGSTLIDVGMIVVAVGSVIWAAASAPWWALSAAAGIGTAISLDSLIAVLGSIGFAGALVVGLDRRDLSELRAVVAGITLNVLIRSDLEGFTGWPSIVGVLVGFMLLVTGLDGRPPAIRRSGWLTLAGVGAAAAVSLAAAGFVSVGARPDATQAVRQARQAVDAVKDGDFEQAASLFDASSSAFARADRRLGGPLALPARLLPVVAQNVAAGAHLSASAADVTAEAAAALRQVDPATLRVVGGSIDLTAVRAAEAPLQRVQNALFEMSSITDRSDSPWLVGPIRDKLDEFRADFDDYGPSLQNAVDAVRLAPALFGGEGPRRYLIMFTSPSEARGLGGYIGNYAEISIDDGAIRITEFSRLSDLAEANLEERAYCDGCAEELLTNYGRFGFTTGPDGSLGSGGWYNITMPAHFPYIAQAAQVLYPQNGGNPIDGVVVMDPYVVEALMLYTGPIDVPELGVEVVPSEAAEFILHDQYILAEGKGYFDRIDALGTLGTEVIKRLLTGTLPEPTELFDALGPLVDERRLLVWTDRDEEQLLLDRVGLLGAIPEMGGDGGFSVSVTNGSGNKIDVFLDREVETSVVVADDGTRTLVADVRLTNSAPTAGLPQYVIGNSLGLPPGWSRLFVTFYGPPTLESATVDGRPLGLGPLPEAGWMGYSRFVELAPGQQRSFRLIFRLDPRAPGDASPAFPTVWEQPLSSRS